MKILHIASHISDGHITALSKRASGYGYMVVDIATSLSENGCQCDIYSQSNFLKEVKINKARVLEHKFINVICKARIIDLINGISMIFHHKIFNLKALKILFFHLSMGHLSSKLKNEYDIVHVHGIGYATSPVISLCEKINVECIVTLHGLNSFSKTVKIGSREKLLEKEFLKNFKERRINLTVISQGVKKTILDFLALKKSAFIQVIPNGFNFPYNDNRKYKTIREKYSIKKDERILLCVGNLSERKNQIQLIRVYEQLSFTVKNKLKIFLLGNDLTHGEILNAIIRKGMQKNIFYCGNIPKHQISSFYQEANYTCIVSKNEGFGLSAIEGFSFGLPCLIYSNLDAVTDIYNPESVLLVKGRDDNSLKLGIEKLFKKKWESNLIKKHASKFSIESMAMKYKKYYESILKVE